MDWFDKFWLNVRVADVLDILIIAFLIYQLMIWIRRYDAGGVAIAIIGLLAVYAVARFTDMYLTLAVFQTGLVLIVVSLVIVFQQDVRQAIERLAAWRPLSKPLPPVSSESIETLVEAVSALAEHRMGALIVLEGKQTLDRHLRGGTVAGAELSVPLLQSIFDKHSPGHDGAAIIRLNRLDKFGVHLPLSSNLRAVGPRGTRHTAALGLSERSDALVIVVSEERGSISVAEGTRLQTVFADADLKQRLQQFLGSPEHRPVVAQQHMLRRRFGWKLAALAVAALLWFVFAFSVDTVYRTFADVPVEFRDVPPGWRVEQVEPSQVNLTLSGPQRAFAQINVEELIVIFRNGPWQTGTSELTIGDANLALPPGVNLVSGEAPQVNVEMHHYEPRRLPIRLAVSDPAALDPDTVVLHIDPPEVEVLVRGDHDDTEVDAIPTVVVPVESLQPPARLTVNLELPDTVIIDPPGKQVTITATAP